MAYTYKSLAGVWFITLALSMVTASGEVAGWWLLLLLATAFATPFLILRSPAEAAKAPHEHGPIVADARGRSPLSPVGLDLYRWENEGGAQRMHVNGGSRQPAHGGVR